MPRPALTPEQRSEIRRRLRQAAAELFAENGLSDISARSIAQRAGVSVGTIYAHFDNLTDLMQSLWKAPVARLLEDMERSVDGVADPEERVRIVLNKYAEFARTHSAVYRGAFLFIRPASQEKPERAPLAQHRMFRLLRDAIADGQRAGAFVSGDPVKIAQTLWAGLHGALALPVNIDRVAFDPPELQAKRMIKLLLASLKRA